MSAMDPPDGSARPGEEVRFCVFLNLINLRLESAEHSRIPIDRLGESDCCSTLRSIVITYYYLHAVNN